MTTAKKTGGGKTSESIAQKAAKTLSTSNNPTTKTLAGSVLSQKGTDKNTSTKVGTVAGKVLSSSSSGKATRELAGSALKQKTTASDSPKKSTNSSGTSSGGPRKKS